MDIHINIRFILELIIFRFYEIVSVTQFICIYE